jgi:hypothetical protein
VIYSVLLRLGPPLVLTNGATAAIVDLDCDRILEHIIEAMVNDVLVDSASERNFQGQANILKWTIYRALHYSFTSLRLAVDKRCFQSLNRPDNKFQPGKGLSVHIDIVTFGESLTI